MGTKQITLWIAATLVLPATILPTPALAQQVAQANVVIVDMDRVVNESAAGKQAGIEIQGRIAASQARRANLSDQLRAEYDDIRKGQENNTLTGPSLEARIRDHQTKQSMADQEIQRREQDLQSSRAFIISQITQAANPIITAIMLERNASIALEKDSTLQHSSSLDITAEVIARLNAQLPRVSITPPAQ